jgi:hypothetical protein
MESYFFFFFCFTCKFNVSFKRNTITIFDQCSLKKSKYMRLQHSFQNLGKQVRLEGFGLG